VKGEREAKKEVVRILMENDELKEKAMFLEHRYAALINKLGAS
jgi:hypothetical protein